MYIIVQILNWKIIVMISYLSLIITFHNIWYELFLLHEFSLLNDYIEKYIMFTLLKLVIYCLGCRIISNNENYFCHLAFVRINIIFTYYFFQYLQKSILYIKSFLYNNWHCIILLSKVNNFMVIYHFVSA